MKTGLQPLVHAPTRVSEIDLDATVERRRALHEAFRLHQHLIELLRTESIDTDRLHVEAAEP